LLNELSEQEPVAYHDYDEMGGVFLVGRNDAVYNAAEHRKCGWELKPLYAQPKP